MSDREQAKSKVQNEESSFDKRQKSPTSSKNTKKDSKESPKESVFRRQLNNFSQSINQQEKKKYIPFQQRIKIQNNHKSILTQKAVKSVQNSVQQTPTRQKKQNEIDLQERQEKMEQIIIGLKLEVAEVKEQNKDLTKLVQQLIKEVQILRRANSLNSKTINFRKQQHQ